MTEIPTSDRSRVRRLPARACYERDVVHEILDQGYVCHVGISQGEDVFVVPMNYVRIGNSIFLHGSPRSRLLRALAGGSRTCVTVTHQDGIVLARSACHHSFNYRSVMAFGTAKVVPPEQQASVLDAFLDRFAPGRRTEVRPPSAGELAETLVVEIPIEEASAKMRSGPPKDDPADRSRTVRAGVVPLRLEAGELIPDQ